MPGLLNGLLFLEVNRILFSYETRKNTYQQSGLQTMDAVTLASI